MSAGLARAVAKKPITQGNHKGVVCLGREREVAIVIPLLSGIICCFASVHLVKLSWGQLLGNTAATTLLQALVNWFLGGRILRGGNNLEVLEFWGPSCKQEECGLTAFCP